MYIYIYMYYILYYIYIYICVYIYISKNLQFSFSLVSLKHIWAKDTIITVFLICTEILLSAIILTSQARSAHTRPPGNISWYRLKVKLILYQYRFMIFIIIIVIIIIITIIISELLILITNASLKTTVHHLSLIVTFFEVCIT